MSVLIQVLSVLAMLAGGCGSKLFVDTTTKPANYTLGSMVFLVGNTTNIAIGLYLGDLSLVLAQAGLAYFTLPMYSNRKFTIVVSGWLLILIAVLGVAAAFHFTASGIGVIASAMAIYGAWAMSKQKWNIMNWMWVLADLLFIYIAIQNRLVGLGLLAALFVWHGTMRIMGYKQTGLFSFSR